MERRVAQEPFTEPLGKIQYGIVEGLNGIGNAMAPIAAISRNEARIDRDSWSAQAHKRGDCQRQNLLLPFSIDKINASVHQRP